MNIIPEDIIERILRRKPYWLNGPPKISLYGENHKFGILSFNFNDGEIIQYNIFITDRQKLREVAENAITMINAGATRMER